MSIESVNQFLIKVSREPRLRAEIDRVIKKGNARHAVTKLGAKYGYKFTPKELARQIQECQKQLQTRLANSQLSEEELEAVAGGAAFISPEMRAWSLKYASVLA